MSPVGPSHAIILKYWAAYGDYFQVGEFNEVFLHHHEWGPTCPVSKTKDSERFATKAARAMERLDVVFFERAAVTIRKIKDFQEGTPHDRVAYMIACAYMECTSELMAEEFRRISGELRKGRLTRTIATPDHVPSFREVISRCETNPDWPQEGDPVKHASKVAKQFDLAFRPARRGRPKRQRK